MNTQQFPDDTQLECLFEIMETHGVKWRQVLLEAWQNGTDVNLPKKNDGAYLRQLRNHFGPKWLSEISDEEIQSLVFHERVHLAVNGLTEG